MNEVLSMFMFAPLSFCKLLFHTYYCTDDYRAHTSCTMTEVGNLVANRSGHANKKKASPQEAWMELLHASVETAPSTIKQHLQQMVTLDNIPRKEKQFRNFASNSLHLRHGPEGKKTLDAIWGYLNEQRETLKKQRAETERKAKEQKELQKQKQQEKQKQSAKDEEDNDASDSDSGEETSTPAAPPAVATTINTASISDSSDVENKIAKKSDDETIYKSVKKATKKMLKKAPGHSMKFKSLQKALREKVGVDKRKLQEVMDQVVAKESKKFMVEGKQIRLVVS